MDRQGVIPQNEQAHVRLYRKHKNINIGKMEQKIYFSQFQNEFAQRKSKQSLANYLKPQKYNQHQVQIQHWEYIFIRICSNSIPFAPLVPHSAVTEIAQKISLYIKMQREDGPRDSNKHRNKPNSKIYSQSQHALRYPLLQQVTLLRRQRGNLTLRWRICVQSLVFQTNICTSKYISTSIYVLFYYFLNYVNLVSLMGQLGYLTEKAAPDSVEKQLVYKMWSLLSQKGECISVENVKKFLLAIEGICYDTLNQTTKGSLKSLTSINDIQTGSATSPTVRLDELHFQDGVLYLTTPLVHRIFLKFKPLYINRVVYHKSQRNRSSHASVDQQSISKEKKQRHRRVTQQLGSAYPTLSPRVKSPYISKEERDLKECTFQPNPQRQRWNPNKWRELYALAQRRVRRSDKSREELEYEKAQGECTFKPKLSKSPQQKARGGSLERLSSGSVNLKQLQMQFIMTQRFSRVRFSTLVSTQICKMDSIFQLFQNTLGTEEMSVCSRSRQVSLTYTASLQNNKILQIVGARSSLRGFQVQRVRLTEAPGFQYLVREPGKARPKEGPLRVRSRASPRIINGCLDSLCLYQFSCRFEIVRYK